MEQAKSMDEEPVRLLSNFSDGKHGGYVGDILVLPSELAARLIEHGAAEAVAADLPPAAADLPPAAADPAPAKPGSKGK
jgi:hypothetical protein